MKALFFSYFKNEFFPFLIFWVSVVAGIVWQQPLAAAVPFVWLAIPQLYRWLVVKPAQLFWLMLAMLPLSTELNLTPQLGLDFPDEPLLMLLTGIILVKLFHQPRWFPAILRYDTLFFVLTVYFLWLVVTCIYSAEPLLSVKYVLAKTWYILPFVLLPQVLLASRDRIITLALCLVIPMVFVVAQTLLRHAQYGFAFDKVQKTMSPFFRNHVNYSSMLVCLLPIGWCCRLWVGKESALRKWINLGLLIGLLGLLFAYSRGAWLALLAGLATVWVIRKKRMGVLIAFSIIAVLVSTVWLITDNRYMRFAPDHDHTVFHTDFSEHLGATIRFRDVSNAERFHRWIAGVRMLAEKPLTGFGPNTFYLHYRPYTVNRFETWVSDNPEHSTVHNYFILVALEQGIMGLVLFCILYFGMLLRIQKLYHGFQSRFYRMTAMTTGVILVMTGVINSLSDMIETDKIGSLFWLCLGMVILLDGKAKEERESMA